MAPKRSPTTTGLGRGKRAKNNIVCIVGLKNRPDLNGRYGTVRDHDKSTDRYTIKVSGKKNEEEESVLVKSENVTNVDSKRAIQARKKGQFNTLEKLFAKKTGGQQQTEEEGGAAKKTTNENIFVSPKVKVKKEEHRTTEVDTDDDDEGDKREHKKAVITSFHQFPPDGTAIPGPSASSGLSFSSKKERRRKKREELI
ncbi:unnamed protein product [Bathycoccus prasinos]|jgi:hypothetical protein